MTEEAKIVISADDKATPKLKKMQRGAKRALSSVASSAKRAAESFKKVGAAATHMNQALELGRKAWEVFRLLVVETIATSAEFRGQNDKAIKSLMGFAQQLKILRARIGDALIPVLQGFAKGLEPVVEGMTKWIRANRKWLGQNMVNTFEAIALALVQGVATGVGWVVKAWAGWQEIINVVDLALNRFFEYNLEAIDLMIGAMAKVAGIFGENGLTKSLRSAQEGVREMAANFREGGDTAKKNIGVATSNAQRLLNKVNEVSKALSFGIRAGAEAGRQAVQESSEGGIVEMEKLEAAAQAARDRATAAIDAMVARRNAARQKELVMNEADIRRRDKMLDEQAARDKARNEQVAAQQQALAQQTATALSGVMLAATEGQEAFQESVVAMMKDTMAQLINMAVQKAVTNITANAAEGASSAAAANAGVPGVGPIIAAAAATAMFALIMGFKDKIKPQGFNRGGIVPGVGTTDTVPAMLTPGEAVIPKNMVQQMANGGPKQVSVSLNMQSMAPPTNPAELRVAVRDVLGPELVKLVKSGQLAI